MTPTNHICRENRDKIIVGTAFLDQPANIGIYDLHQTASIERSPGSAQLWSSQYMMPSLVDFDLCQQEISRPVVAQRQLLREAGALPTQIAACLTEVIRFPQSHPDDQIGGVKPASRPETSYVLLDPSFAAM